jgi:hypothetical protein
MKDLFSRLEDRERKVVTLLAAIFGSVVILLTVFGVRAGLDAGRAARRRAGIETAWSVADRSRRTAVSEWERWTQARTDIKELRRTWFYDRSVGIRALREDLRGVLNKAGVTAMDFDYGEADVVKDRIRKMSVRFAWGGSYPAFRHILETIEAHPRALQIAKIEFRNVGGVPGYVEAGFTLEGYAIDE